MWSLRPIVELKTIVKQQIVELNSIVKLQNNCEA